MRIHYSQPFSVEKEFLKELDYYMNLLPHPQDWMCFTDGDTMFVRGDYGKCIMEYVNRYPETGMFTCYASRCSYKVQVPPMVNSNNDSILYHTEKAYELHNAFQAKQGFLSIKRRIAGHMMLIRKSTWQKIRASVFQMVRNKNKKVLGVDTQISYAVLAAGLDIKLMQAIYLVHYFRMKQGIGNNNHLL